MNGQSNVIHGVPAESLVRLKPQKLGRHYHKVPQFIRETMTRYPRLISDYFLGNYRINLELQTLDIHEELDAQAACIFRGPLGKIGFSIDRSLLTEALECYYGGTCLPNADMPPISTSEQRMRNRLGQDVVQIFGRAMLGGESLGELHPHDNTYEEVHWEYIAEFRYLSHVTDTQAALFVYLDHQLVDELTQRLTGPQLLRQGGNPVNNIKHLPVRLDCVLAALQLPLSQVLGLRPGNVIPVRLRERCDVQISGHRLFNGTLFEEDGALFLTSLESVKTP